jgi:hypothetical protein
MKVKLKDSIISELTALGLRPGDVIESNDINKTTGAVQFTKWHNASSYNCVVWPEDYEIIEDEKVAAIPAIPDWVNQISKNIPDELTLPMLEITNALDAMYWCFSPYLDNSDLSELPWIENLIKSYNGIVTSLPSPGDLQYETVEY